MKTVLVVDDEEDMLWMLQRNLNKGMSGVEILAAKSGEEALAILSDKSVNLVITDINMPGMNGLDLLIEINNRYPQTGVIIMTAYPSNAYKNEAMMSGSLRFIEKPFDINDMRKTVEQVLKEAEGFQGRVDGIELMDIVQFNGLSRATAALKVTTTDHEGIIFFKNGEVVHAMCDNESGEKAFFSILKFQGGSLQNIKGVEPPVVTIEKSLESLLFEVALKSDESGGEVAAAPAESALEDLDSAILESTSGSVAPFAEEKKVPIPTAPAPPDLPRNDTQSTAPADNPGSQSNDQTSTEDNEMTNIQKILAEFTGIEGVHTACLVGRDGFLLDSLARSGIDAEMIGAIASSGFGSAESMGMQLGQGNLNMTMLEYGEGPVLFAPVGEEAFLVIVADKDTNLGWIRIAIKKNAKRIQEAASL